jgi:hypothetical protein
VVKEIKKSDRKAWTRPELKRISAGSAEVGQGTFPDGGGPGNARS